jgi:cytochrome c5
VNTSKRIITVELILATLLMPLVVVGQANSATKQPNADNPAAPPTSATHKIPHTQNEGERIFSQNCSRCHNAPEGFSPRIAGTVVRHMRVRAQLSQHDEQELLRFFNP